MASGWGGIWICILVLEKSMQIHAVLFPVWIWQFGFDM
jgi:hypothetical protein